MRIVCELNGWLSNRFFALDGLGGVLFLLKIGVVFS